jgi:hypothetical protein
MQVKVDEIEKIITLVLSRLRQRVGNEVEINVDYYWDISTEQLYNPYEKPSDISLGQLSDDIAEINRLLNDDSEISYDLKRIGNILVALSKESQSSF